MKAVGYIRVSTEEQAKEGVSLDAQEERVHAYATMQGLDLVGLVREEGVSATIPLADRPGGAKLLELVKKHRAGHVVAMKLDRLFRDAADALIQTRAWDKGKVALHLLDVGGQTINTSTAMGRMFLTMMAGFAELERNLIAERTTAAMAYKKAHGEVYAPTPFGYDRAGDRLVINTGEGMVIRKVRRWRMDGDSLHRIAARLNDQGVPGKQGGRWYASTIRYLLGNELHRA